MIVSAGLPTGMEGLTYPIPFSSPERILQIAKHAEELGYHSVWGNDHMTTQQYVRKKFSNPPNYWEPLITYCFVAMATTRLRFGTSLLILPMRHDIVVLAKQIATLDHFSGGRLEIGIGVGAYREEFEALHPAYKAHRGDMVEEGVRALQRLFADRNASFDGVYYNYRDVEMYPKPLQDPFPLYIGGNNINAIRRTALLADGWIPACLHIDRLRSDVSLLKELCEENDRDFTKLEIAPQYITCLGKTHKEAVDRFHQSQMFHHLVSLSGSTLKEQGQVSHEEINLVGSPTEVLEKAIRIKEAGATHLLGLYFAANDFNELLDQMQFFAEEVGVNL
jgi:probable F420-dependent oxidoreductase